MSVRDAVAQGRIRYNLELDTLEVIGSEFDMWEPINPAFLSQEDLDFLRSNYNKDMIDRILGLFTPPS